MDSTSTFLQVLRERGLVEPEQLEAINPTQFPDPKTLARELIQRGWLTPYQVNQIFQGKAAELVLGPYILLERLGEGGMGQVFKAKQAHLDRIVALKVIRKERLANPATARRFQREVKAVAQLSHPNIVLAFDADQVGSTYFLVMEYVEGTDLGRLVQKNGPLPIGLACSAIRQAALGLQHVLDRGMVHRDIKPSNLILTGDWQSANGGKGNGSASPTTIKILDMGLTRGLGDDGDDSSTLTQEGSVMGTPDFISPEQAMNSHTVDIRADLYSLGCTFYFLLTGRGPFPGGTALQKLLQHRLEQPTPVQQLRPDIPPGVAAIIRKLMAKDPDNRFQTPAMLANALEPFASGNWQNIPAMARPVEVAVMAIPLASTPGPTVTTQVAPDRPFRRSKEEEQRQWRRMMIGGGGLLAVSLLLFFVLLASQFKKPKASPTAGEQPPAPDPAEMAWQSLRYKAENPSADLGPLRQDILQFRTRFPGTPQALEAAKLLTQLASPLDKFTVRSVPIKEQFRLMMMGRRQGDLVAVLGQHQRPIDAPLRTVAIGPDCLWLAAGGNEGGNGVVLAGNVSRDFFAGFELLQNEPITCVQFSPDGRTLAYAGWDQVVRMLNITLEVEDQEPVTLTGHGGWIFDLAFSPDGKLLASASNDKTVKVWDLATGKARHTLEQLSGGILAVRFSPDGQTLATGSRDATVRLYEVATGRELATLTGHEGAVTTLAFSPDGRTLASGSEDTKVKLWDVTPPQLRKTLAKDRALYGITSVAYCPDGKSLVAASRDSHLVFWNAANGALEEDWQLPAPCNSVAWAADGRHLATANSTHTVYVFRLKDQAFHEP